MNVETKYVCTGECGGSVSEAEYAAGKTTCGTATCSRFGQPFEKKTHCVDCGAEIKDGEAHQHQA